jgi:stage V sporulation protein B
LELSCAAVIAAGTAAQAASFLLLGALYLEDRRRYADGTRGSRLTIRMLHIAMPLALSAYARTSLNTLQHILVPKGLRRAGQTADSAMADYGVIQGMAFPVVTFPACLLAVLSELLCRS